MLKERVLTDAFTKHVINRMIFKYAHGMCTGSGIEYIVTHHLEVFSKMMIEVYFDLYDSLFKSLCDVTHKSNSVKIVLSEVNGDDSDGVRLI